MFFSSKIFLCFKIWTSTLLHTRIHLKGCQSSLLYSSTFTQLNRNCHWVILSHVAFIKIKSIPIVIHYPMYPARDTLQPRSQGSLLPTLSLLRVGRTKPWEWGWINYSTWSSEIMEESGVTKGGKNTASFLFGELTQQHKHDNINMKPQA